MHGAIPFIVNLKKARINAGNSVLRERCGLFMASVKGIRGGL